jgi:glycosidase
MKTTIYQLFVRHFGNLNTSGIEGGTIQQNGCGKFADINNTALMEIKMLGFTHVWLTGVLEHASGTAYPGMPADDPRVLKGLAGSPYAVKDYFDVSPDLAVDVKKRIDEFKELVQRCQDVGLKVLIDFIPNHVARSYESDVRPELSFGKNDDVTQFCAPNNNFY